MTKGNLLLRLGGIFVSVFLVMLLFSKVVNIQDFLLVLPLVNVPLFFASDIPYLVQSLIMGFKLKYAFGRYGKKISFWNGLFSHSFGMFLSNFSFGRAGYLGAIIGLDEDKAHSTGIVSGIILVDIISKVFLFVMAMLVYPYLFLTVSGDTVRIMSIGSLFGAGLLVCSIFFLFVPKYIPIKHKIFDKFVESFNVVKMNFFQIFSFSMVGWFLRGAEWYILSRAVGFELSYLQCLVLHPMIGTLRLIPVSLSGLGIVEFAIINLVVGVEKSKLVVFTMLDMVNNVFVDWIGLRCLFVKSFNE